MSFADDMAAIDSSVIQRFGDQVDEYRVTSTGQISTPTVLFFDPSESVNLFPFDIQAQQPVALVLRSELPDPRENDTITIKGTQYRVKLAEHDEGEILVLLLKR